MNLRWLGHVRRMNDGRIPKALLYGQVAHGRRHRGRPKLHYKDCCKREMKSVDVSSDIWETTDDHSILYH